jgi:dolichol-phosphate mannosyltransferase
MGQILTSIVIPCFNEVEGIYQLCGRLRELLPVLSRDGVVEIVFVDDGSTDGTADAIRREADGLPYVIATHPVNKGLGAALRTGFATARGLEIVTMDSDCTYDPLQSVELLRVLREGKDVVTGSPYHPDGRVVNVVGWRLMISKTLSFMYWLLLPTQLYTYTSCFRAYRRDAIPALEAPDDGFLAVTQLLVSGILRGCYVAEVPAVLTSRKFGRSKIRTLQVALSHLRYLAHVIRIQMAPNSELDPVVMHPHLKVK